MSSKYALCPKGYFVHPKQASRGIKYTCPHCSGIYTLNKGTKVKPYFSHKHTECIIKEITNNNKNESKYHKAIKLKIKNMLIENREIEYSESSCVVCDYPKQIVKKFILRSNDIVKDEYRMKEHNIIPDIVVIRDDKVVFIVEICYTNPQSNRPGNWIELNVSDVLKDKLINVRHTTCQYHTCSGDGKCYKFNKGFIQAYDCYHQCIQYECADCNFWFPEHRITQTEGCDYCKKCYDKYIYRITPRICSVCKESHLLTRRKCGHETCYACCKFDKCNTCYFKLKCLECEMLFTTNKCNKKLCKTCHNKEICHDCFPKKQCPGCLVVTDLCLRYCGHKTCEPCVLNAECAICYPIKKCPNCNEPNEIQNLQCGHELCTQCIKHDKCRICYPLNECNGCGKLREMHKSLCKHELCLECCGNNNCKICYHFYNCDACNMPNQLFTRNCLHKVCNSCFSSDLCSVCVKRSCGRLI